MNEWEQLIKHALLGTERHPFALPSTPRTLLPLWEQLQTKEPVEQLLHTAALLAEYRRASWQLPTVASTFTPSASETLAECSSTALEYLHLILQEQHSDTQVTLLRQWLHWVQRAKQRIPYQLLPTMLDQGQRHKELQPLLATTVGQRGHWLARWHSPWQYLTLPAADVVTEAWETANSATRLAYLQHYRATAPASARELLANTWQQDNAQQRQELLATCWIGLSLADEEFLENCLNDRSQAVRQSAAQMLGSLAESRWLKQMLERLSSYLHLQTGVLKKRLEIHLPECYEPAWNREGIREQRPTHEDMGDKAWWLYQMLILVRPSLLLAKLGISVNNYLNLIKNNDFAQMLSRALVTAAQGHKDVVVAKELVLRSPQKDFWGSFTQLIEAFNDIERETILQEYLKIHKQFSNMIDLRQISFLLPHGLSAEMTQALLTDHLPHLWKQITQQPYYQTEILKGVATILAPPNYETVNTLPWLREGKNQQLQEAIDKFLAIYRLRYQMYKEFNP